MSVQNLFRRFNTLGLVALLGLAAVACKKEEQAAPPAESAAPAPTEAAPAETTTETAPPAEAAPAEGTTTPPAGN